MRHSGGRSEMVEHLLGLLRVRVQRGINLAVRDVRSSDPYVILKMGRQAAGRRGVMSRQQQSAVEQMLGLLMVRVHRGVNLAVRDLRSSDPYVIVMMGKQKLKTRVINRNVNPVWDEDLTLSIEDPSLPVRLEVYDKDTFTKDDPMGHAEFDIQPFVEAVKMKLRDLPDGYIITKVAPSRQNCLAEESPIYWSGGKVCQDLALRLRNVESGEVELQLQWVSIPGSKGL